MPAFASSCRHEAATTLLTSHRIRAIPCFREQTYGSFIPATSSTMAVATDVPSGDEKRGGIPKKNLQPLFDHDVRPLDEGSCCSPARLSSFSPTDAGGRHRGSAQTVQTAADQTRSGRLTITGSDSGWFGLVGGFPHSPIEFGPSCQAGAVYGEMIGNSNRDEIGTNARAAQVKVGRAGWPDAAISRMCSCTSLARMMH